MSLGFTQGTRYYRRMRIDANILSDLVTIRSLQDLALSQARTPGTARRQAAVILLDAAIERTIFSAAEYSGAVLKDADYASKALTYLNDKGWRPEPGIETSRKRLHRQRNVVQHVGTGVDPEDLREWTSATRRLIADIVRHFYGVELESLRYSHAIENAEVRELLDIAESRLALGDIHGSMEAVDECYSKVEYSWNQFVFRSNFELGRMSDSSPAAARIDALQQVSLVSAVVPDSSEALWFLSARQTIPWLNREDTVRALAFVFNFASAVESSAAAKPDGRYSRKDIAARRVRESSDGRASIESFQMQMTWSHPTVVLQLKDVPAAEDFEEWAAIVRRQLDGIGGFYSPSIVDNGQIWIQNVDAHSDVAGLISDIEGILAKAEDAVADARIQEEGRRAAARIEDEAYRRVVATAIPKSLPQWLKFGAAKSKRHPFALGVTVSARRRSLFVFADRVEEILKPEGVNLEQTGQQAWLVGGLQAGEVTTYMAKVRKELEALVLEKEQKTRLTPAAETAMRELLNKGYRMDASTFASD